MKTVILANGDFPRKNTKARQILERASRVVCCDGAADAFRRKLGRECDFVVGDGDSLSGRRHRNVVRIAEQDTNDLEKAIRFCHQRGWHDLVLLGATGKREDHTLGNVFLAMEHGLAVYTDHGCFLPVGKSRRFKVGRDAPVSIFAVPGTRMTSHGLVWPLDQVEFGNFHCATLNRADSSTIRLTANQPAYVYLA